ncbi:phenylalanine--tRNA ligase subunit beta [bacterium]|nr:phenylalanine--tRNA ligase subunit beta [bacterium]
MKILLSWLREFVDFDLSPSELASGLTMQGTEAETVHPFSIFFDGDTAVAQIKSAASEVDEFTVSYEVEIDGGKETAVSRARHIPVGFKVLVRKGNDGVTIPTLAELGLNQLRFPLMIPTTMTLDEVKADALVDFETLSNRGDLLSHLGIAREVSILTGNPWREPEIFEEYGETDDEIARPIQLDAPELCPRYIGITFEDVAIADSPDWMWYRLSALGVNPISNLVDISNYVLMELGQPLHAFDAAYLDGGIIVRRAADGEEFTAINHNEYALKSSNLVIADQSKAVAIGGVMGGVDSEIGDDTKSLFLESAYFTPVNIRKTSKRLGLMSDSCLRFGRGVDPKGAARGALRFAYLVDKLKCGRFVSGSYRDVDLRRDETAAITFPLVKVSGLLGIDIPDERSMELLESAGFSLSGKPPVIKVLAPSWRGDFEIPEDFVEEVLRLYSFTRVEPAMPDVPMGQGRFEDTFAWESRIRDIMLSMALQEVRTYTLVNPSVIRRWLDRPAPSEDQSVQDVLEDVVFLGNPDTAEMSALRVTTGPGLVEVLATNRKKHAEALPVMYEVGRAYEKAEAKRAHAYTLVRDDASYTETRTLGLIVSEEMIVPAVMGTGFSGVSPLYTARAVLAKVASELGHSASFGDAGDGVSPWFERGRALEMKVGDAVVGEVGLLKTELDSHDGKRGRIAFGEMNIDELRGLPTPDRGIESPSQFPAIQRDLAFIVPLDTPAGALIETIEANGGGNLCEVAVFDQFTGKKLKPREIGGRLTPIKNLAFSLRFQRSDRTLTGDEVDSAIFGVLRVCFEKHGAILRDYEQIKSETVFGDAGLWVELMKLYEAE